MIPTQRPFALVGGLAVSARTEPRFTRDIDFVVAVENDTEAEEVVFQLQRIGFLVDATIEQTASGRLSTARLRRDAKAPIVDLLFASCGIEAEVAAAADTITVRGQQVPVATIGHLIAMKLIARDDKRRPRDRDDLVQLSLVADEREWERAETAIRLIHERGFSRNRDLPKALAEWRAANSEHSRC